MVTGSKSGQNKHRDKTVTDGGGGMGGHLVFEMPTPAPLVLECIKAMMEITWSSPRDMVIR